MSNEIPTLKSDGMMVLGPFSLLKIADRVDLRRWQR
jgi:hypothetical protein